MFLVTWVFFLWEDEIQDTGYKMQDAGYRIQDTGYMYPKMWQLIMLYLILKIYLFTIRVSGILR